MGQFSNVMTNYYWYSLSLRYVKSFNQVLSACQGYETKEQKTCDLIHSVIHTAEMK